MKDIILLTLIILSVMICVRSDEALFVAAE